MYVIDIDSMLVNLLYPTRSEAFVDWDDFLKYGKKGDKMVMYKKTDRGDITLAKATVTGGR